mmetsp:Transcript_69010/g.150140  ORF Transcript_69010/g.150140 Transcript_69010/m.150140 type:complete len:315 (+) Transcript_69010:722-1666(+)
MCLELDHASARPAEGLAKAMGPPASLYDGRVLRHASLTKQLRNDEHLHGCFGNAPHDMQIAPPTLDATSRGNLGVLPFPGASATPNPGNEPRGRHAGPSSTAQMVHHSRAHEHGASAAQGQKSPPVSASPPGSSDPRRAAELLSQLVPHEVAPPEGLDPHRRSPLDTQLGLFRCTEELSLSLYRSTAEKPDTLACCDATPHPRDAQSRLAEGKAPFDSEPHLHEGLKPYDAALLLTITPLPVQAVSVCLYFSQRLEPPQNSLAAEEASGVALQKRCRDLHASKPPPHQHAPSKALDRRCTRGLELRLLGDRRGL